MSYKVTRLGPPRIRRDTIIVGDVVFEAADLAPLTVEDEGTPLATAASSLDFVGAGVTASGTGATKTITIPGGSGLTIEDEGTPLATDADTLDFVGAGVTASGAGTTKTITIPGGGGGDPFDGKPFVWTPPASADATDDEFNDDTGMSGPVNGLDAKWTKRNMGTSTWLKLDDAVSPGCAYFDVPTGQAASQGIYQTVPSGDWTYAAHMQAHSTENGRQMLGIFCVSSAGTGVIGMMDSGADAANGVRAVSTWGDGGAGTFSGRSWTQDYATAGSVAPPVTITLRKASGVYHMGWSWSHRLLPGNYVEVAYTPTSFTPAFIGFGRIFGTGVLKLSLDFFRKVA